MKKSNNFINIVEPIESIINRVVFDNDAFLSLTNSALKQMDNYKKIPDDIEESIVDEMAVTTTVIFSLKSCTLLWYFLSGIYRLNLLLIIVIFGLTIHAYNKIQYFINEKIMYDTENKVFYRALSDVYTMHYKGKKFIESLPAIPFDDRNRIKINMIFQNMPSVINVAELYIENIEYIEESGNLLSINYKLIDNLTNLEKSEIFDKSEMRD